MSWLGSPVHSIRHERRALWSAVAHLVLVRPMRIRGLMALIPIVLVLTACSRARHLHVRGELDRTKWIVRHCGTQQSYRVIMTSAQWVKLLDYQKQFHVSDADPLVIEFDGTTFARWSWEADDHIGIDAGSMQIQRGTCR